MRGGRREGEGAILKYKRTKLEIEFLTSQEDNYTKSGAQTCGRALKTDDSQRVVLAVELLPPTSTSRHIHVMNAPRPSSLFFFAGLLLPCIIRYSQNPKMDENSQ